MCWLQYATCVRKYSAPYCRSSLVRLGICDLQVIQLFVCVAFDFLLLMRRTGDLRIWLSVCRRRRWILFFLSRIWHKSFVLEYRILSMFFKWYCYVLCLPLLFLFSWNWGRLVSLSLTLCPLCLRWRVKLVAQCYTVYQDYITYQLNQFDPRILLLLNLVCIRNFGFPQQDWNKQPALLVLLTATIDWIDVSRMNLCSML